MAKRTSIPLNGEAESAPKKKTAKIRAAKQHAPDSTEPQKPKSRSKKIVTETANGASLIIVESPSKAKTINKYLGKNYHVEASVGHIKNLPKSKLGIDVENDFQITYEIIKDKHKDKTEVIEKLRAHALKAPSVFIATDPDREGEAIA